jgi:DNA-binding response OmpR family regulator
MPTEAFHDDRRPVEVLVVSPAEEDQEYFRLLFPRPVWRVLAVHSVRDATKLLEARAVGVVLTEHDLEDGPWSDLLDLAASAPWSPPVIVVSRHADEAMWARVLNLGGYDVLMKPFDATEVRRVVGMAVRRRIPQSLSTETPIPDMIGAY